jgi:hypothetical protein
MTTNRQTTPILMALALTLTACESSLTSGNIEFAHQSRDRLYGSPLAFANFFETGKTSLKKLMVCVSSPEEGTISQAEFLLETKIAYASWWHHAGKSLNSWAELDFRKSSSCSPDDATHIAFTALPGTSSENEKKYQISAKFTQPTIICQREGNSARCQSETFVLGVGGPAAVSILSNRQTGQITRVDVNQPAKALFSPFIAWHSLAREIAINPKIPADLKQSLADKYQKLLQKSEELEAGAGANSEEEKSAEFSALTAIIDELESHQLVGTDDTVFQQKFDAFLTGSQEGATLNTSYQPQIAILSTLIHEVGHQFGMNHADNPDLHSITGDASGMIATGSNLVRTDLSVMAYALSYFYLTADDIAGIKNLSKTIPQ